MLYDQIAAIVCGKAEMADMGDDNDSIAAFRTSDLNILADLIKAVLANNYKITDIWRDDEPAANNGVPQYWISVS